MDPYDRAIEQLEDQLETCDDPAERDDIVREIREISREAAERERWQDEGFDRGWF